MNGKNLAVKPEDVKPEAVADQNGPTPFELDDMTLRFVRDLTRAAVSAHQLYRAQPSGPRGRFILRIKSKLVKLQEEVAVEFYG